MKQILLKVLPVLFLIIALISTLGFSAALYGDTTKYKCSLCGYVYDPEVEGATYEELGDDYICPSTGCQGTKEDLVEIIYVKWVCPYCGYVYDPEIDGILFEDLPDDWTCPVCNSLKSDFVKYEEYGEYIISDPVVKHLQHVLAMRSKHLAVLKRVIEDHKAKDLYHSSIPGLENAFKSSSKSVLEAKAKIDEYLGSIKGNNEGNESTEDAQILNSEDNEDENTSNGKSKDNNGKPGKENKEHKNKGKAKGKNK